MDIHERIAALEVELAALKAEVALDAPLPTRGAPNGTERRSTSRRDLLRLGGFGAGAAAVGAITAASSPTPVAAGNGDELLLGVEDGQNTGVTALTRADYTGAGSGSAFVFQTGDQFDASGSTYPSALAGWASKEGTEGIPHGVYGFSGQADGAGVVGWGADGPGVIARSETGLGLVVDGTRANMRLVPIGFPPTGDSAAHEVGEVYVDNRGGVWSCLSDGSPGEWQKLSSGEFIPLTPFRVYDSRWDPAPDGVTTGALTTASRVVSVAHARDLSTGEADPEEPIIRAGAVAIAYNLTIVDYAGEGFLAVTEGDSEGFAASSINWGGVGPTAISNSQIVGIDQDQQIKVFIGGAAPSTHFVIDVQGVFISGVYGTFS